jgi:hypothetical protein
VARIPLAYSVAGRDRELADFLSQWIKLKKGGLKFPIEERMAANCSYTFRI